MTEKERFSLENAFHLEMKRMGNSCTKEEVEQAIEMYSYFRRNGSSEERAFSAVIYALRYDPNPSN